MKKQRESLLKKDVLKSVKDLIKEGVVTFEKIKNSGLYTEAELSAIATV